MLLDVIMVIVAVSAVISYIIAAVLEGYNVDPINDLPQRPAPPKDKLKELIDALVEEDDWEFKRLSFIHPAGVKVFRDFGGDCVISTENITYKGAYASSKYNILKKRHEEAVKQEALRRLADKVVRYHEGFLGQPELESGTELKRLEYTSVLDFGALETLYNKNPKLYSRS